ncbi:TPA: hypothetical protein QDZ10_000091 [Stenotrophomonas maltophilia]|nr:hypothetical protein [Stenotrophomonas maltophilia]
MALSPLDRPLQLPSADRTFDRASRGVSGGLGLRITSVRNSGMASKPPRDLPIDTRTAQISAPRIPSRQAKAVPDALRREGPSASCQDALDRLMSTKQGRPLKECLALNPRGPA